MARIKMHIPKAKLPFYPPCEVKCRLQNGVSTPLLSYINVWHENFLPPKFTLDKTHDLGPRYTCLNELAPIQDESVERMSQRRREQVHKLIQQGHVRQDEGEEG